MKNNPPAEAIDKMPRLPNKVMWARDESAEKVDKACRRLTKVMENYFTIDETTKLQAISLCIGELKDASRYLENIGAPTRPV